MPSGAETAGDARCRGSWDSSAGAAEARSEHRPSLAARNEQSGNGLAITRCWGSGKPERSSPAPEPDIPARRHRANRPQLSWLRPKRRQVYAYSHQLEAAEAACVHVAGRTKFGVAGVRSTMTMAYGRRIAAQLIRSSKHDGNRLFLSTVNLALSALPQCDAD